MKKKRHALIIDLIKEHEIGTQEELLEKLRDSGYDVTQATVSRDIKELRLIKAMTMNNTYRYTINASEKDEPSLKYREIFIQSIISVDYSGNMSVIRCYSGMAPAACAAIDKMPWDGVVGTLAGDDTIFILCRTPEHAQQMIAEIERIIK